MPPPSPLRAEAGRTVRDGGAELPLSAAAARVARARREEGPGLAARDPRLLPPRPPRRVDLAPRLAGADAAPLSARHGDPPRRPDPDDDGPGGCRGGCAELGRARQPLRRRPHGGSAHDARRRHACVLRGHVGRAARRDVVERRLGARRRARPRHLDRRDRRCAAGNRLVRAPPRARRPRRAAHVAGNRPARRPRRAPSGDRRR